ncbi:MAG: PD-(D/E)XK nuclease family protein [Desulfarculus sp.]|nr:PD-(D/E)XK nuclease family protein [Desulfarculus sp.]
MSPDAAWAEIWPSRLALEQRQRELAASSGGLHLAGRLFTFQGRHGIFERLFSQMPPLVGRRPLAELAGPLLLHQILRQEAPGQGLFAGLRQGRRLPHGLWRLLVQVKAAGFDSQQLLGLASARASERLSALAQLLAQYQERLDSLGLADQADCLAGLEAWLTKGQLPPLLEGWSGLEVRQALWLRPLEVRLLGGLARLMPVRVCFALLEPRADPWGVYGLLAATAQALESGHGGDIEVVWRPPRSGPLAELAARVLDPSQAGPEQPSPALELRRLPGRYAEVEALARRALDLVEAGVPAHHIALVFPDLALYGPLAADVAGRLGLPLSFRRGQPLAAHPLAQALLGLLALPLSGYTRPELAQVWESPYLAAPLAAWLLGPGQAVPPGAGRLLARAGYVDGRETPAAAWLRRAAQRWPGREGAALELLARACQGLQAGLAGLGLEEPQALGGYARAVGQVLMRLAPPGLAGAAGQGGAACPWPQEVAVADLAAWQGLKQARQALEQAADQVGGAEPLSPGRCLALWREVLARAEVGAGQGQAGGVAVLRLEDAQGLRPHTLLMGGLSQAEFPRRPAQHLLSRQERLDLGRRAGLPVWRTEEEEYGGQVLRLVLLLSSAREGAWLTSAASDATGRPQAPAFVLSDLARLRGQDLPSPAGGVFGQLPPLAEAREPLALWGGLAGALLRPGAPPEQAGLASALLERLLSEPEQARRWQDIAARARVEQERAALDLLAGPARLAASGAFAGRLLAGPALELLRDRLARPEARRLSPSSLETYAACPLSWYFSRLLGLAEEGQPGWDIERRSEGQWVHHALALFFAPGEFDPAWDGPARRERLTRCLDQAREDLRGQGVFGHDLVWLARRQALLASLGQVVEAEWRELEGLRPLAVEAVLDGQGREGLTLAVDGGAPLTLVGRLDRLDQGPGRLRLTDYKHTSQPAIPRQAAYPPLPGKNAPPGDPPLEGSLQIPIYLAGAAELFAGPGQVLSARLVNTRLPGEKRCYTRDLSPGDALLARDPATRQAQAQAGQPNLYNHVQGLWTNLSQGDLAPRPSREHCQYCPYALVCRARPTVGLDDDPWEAGDA